MRKTTTEQVVSFTDNIRRLIYLPNPSQDLVKLDALLSKKFLEMFEKRVIVTSIIKSNPANLYIGNELGACH